MNSGVRAQLGDQQSRPMLKAKGGGKATEVIRQVFRDYTDYSTDVATYRVARKELLDAFGSR